MKNIRIATLAIWIVVLGSMAAQAQSWTNCSGNSVNNDCIGWDVLSPSSGSDNAVFGNVSMPSNSTGAYNSALGAYALQSNTSGSDNTAVGSAALNSNSTGYGNTAAGLSALHGNTSGDYNTAMGYDALYDEDGDGYDTAVGYGALFQTTTGEDNVAIGYSAGYDNTTGSENTFIGFTAGQNSTTGSYNVDINNPGSSSDTGVIRIGGSNQTSFYAAGIDGVSVGSSGIPVYINSNGQLGTVVSSIRFKEDVHDMGDASSAIFRLRPVTYRYKQAYANGLQTIDYGLIAEEVAKVYPDMVVKGADGQILTVQYQKLTPMMLNELQKQHRLIEEQQVKIEQLEKQLTALPALEKRLTALEAAQPSSARLEARLTTK